MHEAGHALGLSDVSLNLWEVHQPYNIAHPTIQDSALNYDYRALSPGGGHLLEPDCSPHPFHVMVAYALYQTVPIVSISGLELTQIRLSDSTVDNLTPPYSYEWSSGLWSLAFSPSNTSSLVSLTLPDVHRRISIEVKVTDANGKVGRDRHVITVQ